MTERDHREPILPVPSLEVRLTKEREMRRELKFRIVSNMIDAMEQMQAPMGSDVYTHGKNTFQTARVDANKIGWSSEAAFKIATHVMSDKVEKDRESEEDWEMIRGEFPGQFPEPTTPFPKPSPIKPLEHDSNGFDVNGRRRGW